VIVAIESLDGGGKSTQLAALAKYFRGCDGGLNHACGPGCEPKLHFKKVETMHFSVYDSVTGRQILRFLKGELSVCREVYGQQTKDDLAHALALQALMLANRFEHFGKLLEFEQYRVDCYDRGQLVTDCLLICDRYSPSGIAYGVADGLDYEFLKKIHQALPVPTHSFYLDITVEESFRRRPKRDDQYEADTARLTKAREVYLRYFQEGGRSFHILDGKRPAGDITREIVSIIEGG
jgi:thymidylate kinase